MEDKLANLWKTLEEANSPMPPPNPGDLARLKAQEQEKKRNWLVGGSLLAACAALFLLGVFHKGDAREYFSQNLVRIETSEKQNPRSSLWQEFLIQWRSQRNPLENEEPS